MPPEREDPVTPNSGARQQSHGAHQCHACGWSFPNPHPSPKQRRAHKKHCGRMEGSAGGNGELSDGSNRGVTGEEQESGRVRSEGNGCEEEGVGRSNDIKAVEGIVDGRTVEHADVLLISSGSGVSNGSSMEMLENDLRSNDISYIDSCTKESCANDRSVTTLMDGLEKIATTSTHFPSAIGASENSDARSVDNGVTFPISTDPPNKESKNGKTEHVLEMLSGSALCVSIPETNLEHLTAHTGALNEISDDCSACKLEPNPGNNQLIKEKDVLAKQVPVVDSSICASNSEFGLGFRDTAPDFQGGFEFVVDSIMKRLADWDKGDLECEPNENESSSQSCSIPTDCVDTSRGSVYNGNDHAIDAESTDDVMKRMYQETSTEENILDSTRVGPVVLNAESHNVPDLEEVETEPQQQNNTVEDQSLCGNDDKKEHTMPFALDTHRDLLSESNSEQKLEQSASIESSTSTEELNHVGNRSHAIDTYLESTSYQEVSEKQEGCAKTIEADNVISDEMCIGNDEHRIGSHNYVNVQNEHNSEESNSSKGLDHVITYDGEASEYPKSETSELQDNHGEALEEDRSKVSFDGLKDQPCENLNQVNSPVETNDRIINVSKELLGVEGNTADDKRVVLSASDSDISDAQSDYYEALEEDGSEAPFDGLKENLVNDSNQVNSSIETGGTKAFSDVLEEPLGNQRITADTLLVSSIMEHQEEHVSNASGGNNLLDCLKINENSCECVETAVAAKLFTQFGNVYENKEQLQNRESVSPFLTGTSGYIFSEVNSHSCEEHIDTEKGKGCNSKPVIGDDNESTIALEGKYEVHKLVEECEAGNKLSLTNTIVACDDDFKGTATKDCQLENIPSVLLYAEIHTQAALSAIVPGHDELSLAKVKVRTEETGPESTTARKHLPCSLTIVQAGERTLSSYLESARTDIKLDALPSTQMVELKLGNNLEGSNSAGPSGVVDRCLEGSDAIDCGQPDVALSTSTSVDSVSDRTTEDPSLVNRADTPTVHSQQLNGNQYTQTETKISDGSWISDTGGSPSPASAVKSGTETTPESPPAHSLKHCTFQEEANDGEIIESPASGSTGKSRTPLKSLLDEASIESKQELWLPNGQSLAKEQAMPKAISSGTVSDQYAQPAVKRVVQKEWNSPARLPQAAKNSKSKIKGKPQWIPFMCCPSAN